MPRKTATEYAVWPILAILLIGAALRVPLATRNVRFQVDEALYVTIARQVALHGDLYLTNLVIDKPPLLFWTIGGSLALFGHSEFAARLPNVAASLIMLALTYTLVKKLYRDQRVALITSLLLAISPFDRAFAATAFTDPLLSMFVIGGCTLIVHERWRPAGFALALAFATKPSGLQWIPLALALGAFQFMHWQQIIPALLKLVLGFASGFIPLLIWSATRAVIPDFWAFNLYNNYPGRFIRAEEFSPRLIFWLGWLNTIAPLPVIGWLSAPIHLADNAHKSSAPLSLIAQDEDLPNSSPVASLPLQGRSGGAISKTRPLKAKPQNISHSVAIDLILTSYTLGSLALWWLVAFPVYDRYLHTIGPLLLILCARALTTLTDRLKLPFNALIVLVICSPLAVAHLPTAGDPNEFAEIDQVAATLNTLPAHTIVYDHSLGWELGYYLGASPSIRLIWQPTVDDLITAVKTQPGYWVAPRQESDSWLYFLRAAGIKTFGKALFNDSQFVILYLTL